MSILRHEEVAPELRNAYLSLAAKRRREMGEESEAAEAQTPEPPLEPRWRGERREARSRKSSSSISRRARKFLQSVTEKGFGVRSSAYDYASPGAAAGINNMDLTRRQDAVVASSRSA